MPVINDKKGAVASFNEDIVSKNPKKQEPKVKKVEDKKDQSKSENMKASAKKGTK